MENVPRIVRERLKAAAVAVDHPDADLLTALSEHALPERERAQILLHLATCAECREVIALALPVEEPSIAARPIRGRWLTWPRLRWGLVAAGVIVVGSFGVVRYRQSTHPATFADNESLPTRGIVKEAKNQPPPSPPVATSEAREQKQMTMPLAKSSSGLAAPVRHDQSQEFDRLEGFAKLQAAPRDQKTAVGGGAGSFHGNSLAHGPKPPVQWQQNVNQNSIANNDLYAFRSPAPAPAAPAKQQATNGLVVDARTVPASNTRSTAGGPLVVDKRALDVNTLALQGRSAAPLSTAGASTGKEVTRAKPSETPGVDALKPDASKAETAYAYDVSAASGSNFSPTAPLLPESARWSITALGGLQRSLDHGKTWQDVDVMAGAAGASTMSLQMAMTTSRQKALAKDKADSKQAHIVFRAVAANGRDVWAGGSGGNLYHSTDSGEHWTRVVAMWSGVVLTGDIVSVQFADPLQGRIVTSSSEIWTTSDAGQTWQKH